VSAGEGAPHPKANHTYGEKQVAHYANQRTIEAQL